MINGLIREGVSMGASNIHIVPGTRPVFRKNGEINMPESNQTMTHDDIVGVLNSLCSEEQWMQLNQKDFLNFGYSIPDLGRFRVHIVKQRGSYAIAVRILKLIVPERETLGLPKELYDLSEKNRGLILVTGASGMGKSTTIASMIQHINQNRHKVILTLESPIEYLIRHDKSTIIQRDMGTDCPDLALGLRNAELQDVDVVVISSLDSEPVMDLALKIAESGKLVIAGISAANAASALDGFLYSNQPDRKNIKRHKIASVLLGIFSQQLIPEKETGNRILAHELLLMNNVVRTNIMEGNLVELQNILIAGRRQGMISMDYSLYELYQKQKITQETLYEFCYDHDLIKRLEKTM